jgi:OOP family OmpA-OmpF porin
MRALIISSVAAFAAIGNPAVSHAADQDVGHRFYGGASLGASRFEDADDKGSTFKLYGGYQFTDTFGAEIGYLRVGDLRLADSEPAKSRALYTAGTVRWQFGDSFSVSGLLGVSHAVLTNGDADQDFNSLMVGIGAQYRLTPRLDLTLNVDHLGTVAEHQSADMVTAGIVMRF